MRGIMSVAASNVLLLKVGPLDSVAMLVLVRLGSGGERETVIRGGTALWKTASNKTG